MAYFSRGETRNKLILLYFLREFNYEITRNELYRVFAEQGWMDYFDFQAALTTLEEDAFVAAVPCTYGQGYRITPHGESTLAMFEQELPQSLRDRLKQYVLAYRDALRDQSQFAAVQTRLPDGGHAAFLRLMDKSARILDITLHLPDARFAERACKAWPAHAAHIYRQLLNSLCQDEAPADNPPVNPPDNPVDNPVEKPD